jgi:hypothetical protein
MAQARQGSKKRSKTALHLWATAGTALAMAGSASANVEVPSQGAETRIHLAEQEISDVSLGTFYVFDREREFSPGSIILAAGRCGGGCGCGGHGGGCGGGCGGHPGGCMGGGCAVHGGGCGGHPGGCGGCGCAAHHGSLRNGPDHRSLIWVIRVRFAMSASCRLKRFE